MAGQNTLNFTDATFDQDVLNAETPVLVDFWAEWCGPCRMMTPTIDALATDYAGKVKIGKLNVDENQRRPRCGTKCGASRRCFCSRAGASSIRRSGQRRRRRSSA